MTLQRMRGLWAMSRPMQLLSILLVYALGALAARAGGYPLDFAALLWGWLALLPVAVSIHYANEYADHETDALTTPTPFSGGSGAIPAGWVPRSWARIGMGVMLALGMGIASAAVMVGALPGAVLVILLLGAFGGWMYSLPPLRLAWRGWGEADNALLGGMLLPLFGYTVAAGGFVAGAVPLFLPFTLLVFLNLLATTWPDRHADARVGKLTLATRLPHHTLRRLYRAVAALTALMFVVLAATLFPPEVVLASLVALPFVAWGTLIYTRSEVPLASVAAMVVLLLAQIAAWYVGG